MEWRAIPGFARRNEGRIPQWSAFKNIITWDTHSVQASHWQVKEICVQGPRGPACQVAYQGLGWPWDACARMRMCACACTSGAHA